jgi:hypothetical protein|tara:strand:+ start:10384 stop:10836 length:453 start_codon:yes stop_codon:yes gene_type:complete
MVKSEFIVGDQYIYNGQATLYTYLCDTTSPKVGEFKSDTGIYHYSYSNMAPAPKTGPAPPKAAPCFEVYDKIDVCRNVDFREGVGTGEFLYKDPHGMHWIINGKGYIECERFARKVEPKVTILLYGKGSTAQTRQISEALADKILNGEEL